MKQQEMHNSENRYLTPNEAADILNISLSTLKKLIYQDKIKTFKTPGGHHRILKSDLLGGHQNNYSFSQPGQALPRFEDILFESIAAFSSILESRHQFCHGHAAAVAQISCEIARELKFSEILIERIGKAALLHDIGMISVSEGIINKDAALSPRDYQIVKNHPLAGAEMLAEFAIFEDVLPVIRQHHERPDGSGYPYGLENRNICIEAKIIAVAEAFDCMTAVDSYKRPVEFEVALDHIKKAAGSQFDHAVVDAFLGCAKNISTETTGR